MIAVLCNACSEPVRGRCWEITDIPAGRDGLWQQKHYCARCAPEEIDISGLLDGDEVRVRLAIRPS